MVSAETRLELIRRINREINAAVTYQCDSTCYGKGEHWEAAWKSGDCEDIALAKLHKCLDLGIRIDDLMLATCWTELNEYHAVLLVKLDERLYVLDNRFNDVFRDSEMIGYKFDKRQSIGGSKTWVQFS